jgi:FkbM family methyltransferase
VVPKDLCVLLSGHVGKEIMNFHISTKAKLRIASKLYKGVHFFRSFFSGKDLVIAKRGKVTWELDLSEGIDLSIYLFGRFERSTSKALQELVQPGMIVLDIGANIGAHALPMASRVGTTGWVYAFEPTDWAFNRLKRNQSLNPSISHSLTPVQCALTDDASEMPKAFHSSWNLKENSDTHPVHGGRLEKASDSAFMSLDEFVDKNSLTRIDLIKMDVDGFEMKVLRGAKNSLKKFKPLILFELCPHVLNEHSTSAKDLLGLLHEIGYSFFSENNKRLNLSIDEIINQVPDGGSLNLIAQFTS